MQLFLEAIKGAPTWNGVVMYGSSTQSSLKVKATNVPQTRHRVLEQDAVRCRCVLQGQLDDNTEDLDNEEEQTCAYM